MRPVETAVEELEGAYIDYQLDQMLERGLSRLASAPPDARPSELHLELTHRCNLACVMCEHWQQEHLDAASVGRELDLEAWKRMLEGSLLAGGLKTVVVTGGEPWLRHDIVDVLEWLFRRLPGVRIIVLTNLWNTGHLRLKLGELRARGVTGLHLGSSLDGLETVHDRVRGQAGAYEGLLRTMSFLRRDFPEIPFGLTYTLLPENAHQVFSAYALSRSLGVGFGAQWAVQTPGIAALKWTPEAREAGCRGLRLIARDLARLGQAGDKLRSPSRGVHQGLWSELLYWRYLEEYGRAPRRFPFFLRCTAGERHVMVGAEGEVFFCPVNRDRTIGSVKEAPLDALWASPKAAEVRAFVATGACHCWLRCVSTPSLDRLIALGCG